MGGGADPRELDQIMSRPPGLCDISHRADWPAHPATVASMHSSGHGDGYGAECPMCTLVSYRWEFAALWDGGHWELDPRPWENVAPRWGRAVSDKPIMRRFARQFIAQCDEVYPPSRLVVARVDDDRALDLLAECGGLRFRWFLTVWRPDLDDKARSELLNAPVIGGWVTPDDLYERMLGLTG